MVFCSCSFSLSFYGINFLCPASGNFLYLVSKGRSTGCARNENSVSFHHACLPISAGTPKSTVSISFPIVLIGLDNKTH